MNVQMCQFMPLADRIEFCSCSGVRSVPSGEAGSRTEEAPRTPAAASGTGGSSPAAGRSCTVACRASASCCERSGEDHCMDSCETDVLLFSFESCCCLSYVLMCLPLALLVLALLIVFALCSHFYSFFSSSFLLCLYAPSLSCFGLFVGSLLVPID